MPKRGSSTSGTVAVIPHKRQKNIAHTQENYAEEHNENIPLSQNYLSQGLKRISEVIS